MLYESTAGIYSYTYNASFRQGLRHTVAIARTRARGVATPRPKFKFSRNSVRYYCAARSSYLVDFRSDRDRVCVPTWPQCAQRMEQFFEANELTVSTERARAIWSEMVCYFP